MMVYCKKCGTYPDYYVSEYEYRPAPGALTDAPHVDLLRTWVAHDDVFNTPRGKVFRTALLKVAEAIDADRAELRTLRGAYERLENTLPCGCACHDGTLDDEPYDPCKECASRGESKGGESVEVLQLRSALARLLEPDEAIVNAALATWWSDDEGDEGIMDARAAIKAAVAAALESKP